MLEDGLFALHIHGCRLTEQQTSMLQEVPVRLTLIMGEDRTTRHTFNYHYRYH